MTPYVIKELKQRNRSKALADKTGDEEERVGLTKKATRSSSKTNASAYSDVSDAMVSILTTTHGRCTDVQMYRRTDLQAFRRSDVRAIALVLMPVAC
jgi:hypothetical protein